MGLFKSTEQQVCLGNEAEDKVTGFRGIVVGRAEYLNGCAQFCIAPKVRGNEAPGSQWFDEGRVVYFGAGIAKSEVLAPRNGGPNRDAPPAR